jgi:hypothetical protein
MEERSERRGVIIEPSTSAAYVTLDPMVQTHAPQAKVQKKPFIPFMHDFKAELVGRPGK